MSSQCFALIINDIIHLWRWRGSVYVAKTNFEKIFFYGKRVITHWSLGMRHWVPSNAMAQVSLQQGALSVHSSKMNGWKLLNFSVMHSDTIQKRYTYNYCNFFVKLFHILTRWINILTNRLLNKYMASNFIPILSQLYWWNGMY